MARPKEFDVDEAVDRALARFWAHGYGGTSVQDLVDELGINRGSLYGTFGDKDGLYARALARYVDTSGAALTDALASSDGVVDGLRTLLRSFVDHPDGRGCFVVNTVCERSISDPSSRQSTAGAIDATRQALRRALADARRGGEIRDDVEVDTAAEAILVLMQGLQVLTKSGTDITTLGPVIDAHLDTLT